MPNKFQYTELSTRSTIRLIKIQKQKVNDTIVCVLRHAEQTDIEYYALSYVWGDATPTREILVETEDAPAGESFIFPLHENLWRFLDWAWHQGKFDRWFWTDRICLNQKDEKEKAHQIPRMGDIFQNATQVVAWLNE
ncbi:heterokaryon incompatibility protein-domain-containing protein, partial [Phyllosticta citribraziliensis]